jgi:hypothetical protein
MTSRVRRAGEVLIYARGTDGEMVFVLLEDSQVEKRNCWGLLPQTRCLLLSGEWPDGGSSIAGDGRVVFLKGIVWASDRLGAL